MLAFDNGNLGRNRGQIGVAKHCKLVSSGHIGSDEDRFSDTGYGAKLHFGVEGGLREVELGVQRLGPGAHQEVEVRLFRFQTGLEIGNFIGGKLRLGRFLKRAPIVGYGKGFRCCGDIDDCLHIVAAGVCRSAGDTKR